MPLNSKQILELTAARSSSGLRGRLEVLRRQLDQAARDRKPVPPSYRALVTAMLKVAEPSTGRPTPYAHPGRGPASRPAGPPRSLTAGDLAWLDQLPRDPAQVSDDDAAALARLARQVALGSSDDRIVQAAWTPVRQLHDARAREHDLGHARSVVTLPEAELQAALADALADETETAPLNERTRSLHARELLDQALDTRAQAHDADLDAIARTHDQLAQPEPRRSSNGQRGRDEAVRRFGDRARVSQ